MPHYTENEYLELQHHMHTLQPIDKNGNTINEPESKLASKIRKYCKNHLYPTLIFPQSQELAKYIPKGFPDVTIFLKTRVIFLELKSTKGVLKKHQKLMAQILMQLGHEWYLVRSFKRFLEIIYGAK